MVHWYCTLWAKNMKQGTDLYWWHKIFVENTKRINPCAPADPIWCNVQCLFTGLIKIVIFYETEFALFIICCFDTCLLEFFTILYQSSIMLDNVLPLPTTTDIECDDAAILSCGNRRALFHLRQIQRESINLTCG